MTRWAILQAHGSRRCPLEYCGALERPVGFSAAIRSRAAVPGFRGVWTPERWQLVNCWVLPITSTMKTFRKNQVTVEGNCSLSFIRSNPPNFSLKITVGVSCGVHTGVLDIICHQLYVVSILLEARNQVPISLTLTEAVRTASKMKSPAVSYCRSSSLQGRTERSLWNSLINDCRDWCGSWAVAPVPQPRSQLTTLCTLQFVCKLAQLCSSAGPCGLATWNTHCEIVTLGQAVFFQCTHRIVLASLGIVYIQSRTELHFFF